MRRRHKIEEPDNPDRWVVSYADFITLLFAFFTTMYAISHVDQGKLEKFAGSMKSAFRTVGTEAAGTPIIEGIRPPSYADIGLEREVRAELAKFGIIEGIVVSRDERGVVLSFGDPVLFEPGAAGLKAGARPLLSTLAAIIRKAQRQIVIEGHTDNLPLRGQKHSTNLELSATRAAAVFGALLEEGQLSPDRITTAGYGEYRPVASNALPDGRMRNRRVDIIFVTRKDGM